MNFLFPYMARWKAINWTRYHQIFTHLAKLGHSIYILQPPSANINETNFQEIEIKLPDNLFLFDIDINPPIWNSTVPFNKLMKKGYYSILCRKKIREITSKVKIDVLFLYNLPQYFLMNEGTFLTVFDVADDYVNMLRYELGMCSNPLVLGLAKSILMKMVKRADLTLTPSKVLADSLNGDEKGRTRILPNGVDSDEFAATKNLVTRAPLPKPVVGFVGAFEYFVDLDLMLTLAEKLPHITFLLVGSGRDFNRVAGIVKRQNLRNVVLTGAVPHSEVAGLIQQMDICLNVFKKTPVSECAIPIKLFEYLVMKKPVISSRLKELERLDKDFIFFADTVDECVDSINLLLSSKSIVSEYIERGYHITVENYTWDKITIRLLELISQIQKH